MIDIQVGGRTVRAYLAQPTKGGFRAGVVVGHERWGLNDQIKGVADRVAALGYATVVPDLFDGKIPSDAGLARALVRGLGDDRGIALVEGAAARLRALPGAAPGMPVGVIGFDMGARLALLAAFKGADLQAVVMFYGALPDALGAPVTLQAPVLGLFGDLDRDIPVDGVKRFESAMAKAGKRATIKIFPGAFHSFFNEQRASYDREIAGDAWNNVTGFLAKHLGQGAPPDDAPGARGTGSR
jgi:carboxymethylenebutenolidase